VSLSIWDKLEYLAVYGRACMGVPVGELQSTLAPTTDCDWSAIGPPTVFFVTDRNVTTTIAPHSVREARLKTSDYMAVYVKKCLLEHMTDNIFSVTGPLRKPLAPQGRDAGTASDAVSNLDKNSASFCFGTEWSER